MTPNEFSEKKNPAESKIHWRLKALFLSEVAACSCRGRPGGSFELTGSQSPSTGDIMMSTTVMFYPSSQIAHSTCLKTCWPFLYCFQKILHVLTSIQYIYLLSFKPCNALMVAFLVIQNSSIGDLVAHFVTQSISVLTNWQRTTHETCGPWDQKWQKRKRVKNT